MSQVPGEGKKKKNKKVTQAHQGISFSLPVLFILIFPDAWTRGVHLVSSAISRFIDCVGDESCTAGSWS